MFVVMNDYICWIVLLWEIELLELRLPSGLKALIFRHYILPTRCLNTSLNDMVQRTNVFILLQKTLCDPSRAIKHFNRSTSCPEECVNVVMLLRRFQRSYFLRGRAILITAFYKKGYLDAITSAMVEQVQESWKNVFVVASRKKRFLTRQAFGKLMATLLTSETGRTVLPPVGTLNSRSASMPRIRDGQSKRVWAERRRSRSVSPRHLRVSTRI